MPAYQCKVRDHRGEAFIKTIQGESPDEVRVRLREMGYMVVTPITLKRANPLGDAAKTNVAFLEALNRQLATLQRVKLDDLTVFSRQFATMNNAGIAMVRTLNILAEQTSNGKLRKIIGEIKLRVEAG
ncbi:MAG: type II secretion system F family protein, partial [Cyanobacteria bacterium REEB65]|nr:type II secretion system F family protein [Cyanobacteria bacterium REEB65]